MTYLVSGILPDLRFALRALARGGVGIVVALATLAVALAASVAIFAVVREVLFAPIPAHEPHDVMALARWSDETRGPMPIQTFFDWQERNRTLESLGAYTDSMGFNLEGAPPERVAGVAVSAGFFDTLSIAPVLGSTFAAEADEPGTETTVVISHGLWMRRFGGASDVIGRSLVLDGYPWDIVAVMPPAFYFPSRNIDVWLPMGSLHQSLGWHNRSMAPLYAVGRRLGEMPVEQVRLDLESVTETIAEDTGVRPQPQPLVTPLTEHLLGSTRNALTVLGGAVFFVLLIACANVANLLLARGFGRRDEISVRMALGARRRQVVRLMLVESTALAVVACGLGLLLAAPLARAIATWIPGGVTSGSMVSGSPFHPSLTPGVALFGLLLALASGLALGIVPALHHSRQTPATVLRQGRRSVTPGSRFQAGLVVAEVAVATALLVAAGLMLRTLDRLVSIDPGFDPAGVLVQRVAPNPETYTEMDDWFRLGQRLVERSESLSSVDAAAVALSAPFDDVIPSARLARPDQPLRPDLPLALNLVVSPGYFGVTGARLTRGRDFDVTDDLDHPLVAIVDEAVADALWPDQDPLGRRIAVEFLLPEGGYREGAQVEAIWRQVVGVAPTAQLEDLRQQPKLQVYLPLTQPPNYLNGTRLPFALLSKTRGVPELAAAALQAAVSDIDPTLPIFGARTLSSVLADQLRQERLLSTLLSGFALLAMLLAAAGVYAALSNLVARRTREVGLRLALGADPGRLLRQVAWRGLRLAVWGAALGVAASVPLTRILQRHLYGIERLDPLTYLSVPLLLLSAAAVACLLPAWRASRVDPAECLRYE